MKHKAVPKLLLAIGIGFFVINGIWAWSNAHKNGKVAGSTNQYPFLSKRIFTESQNDILINFTPLREILRGYINSKPYPIGLYFEYLPSGTSIGVNEQMQVRVASLVKVPAVMAIMKEVENNQLSLDEAVTIEETDLDKGFGDLWKKGAGTRITMKEAVALALQESDNTAVNVLFSKLKKGSIDLVYDALDIPISEGASFPHIITPKDYTSILRSLYLSSFLTKEESNYILLLLTQTKFNDKIPASVPNEIPIAHKVGVYQKEGEPVVYSDCGIVYVPNRPYSLCIMVQAPEEMSRMYINDLSQSIYTYISRVGK